MTTLRAVLSLVRSRPEVLSLLALVAFVQLALVAAALALATNGRPALALVFPTVALVGLFFIGWLRGVREIAAAYEEVPPPCCGLCLARGGPGGAALHRGPLGLRCAGCMQGAPLVCPRCSRVGVRIVFDPPRPLAEMVCESCNAAPERSTPERVEARHADGGNGPGAGVPSACDELDEEDDHPGA